MAESIDVAKKYGGFVSMNYLSMPGFTDSKEEVEAAILRGEKAPAKRGRQAYRLNLQYEQLWGEKWYPMKQVMPIVKEEGNELIVITVYVFYF